MAEKLNEIKTKVKQAAVQKKKAVKNAVFKIKGGGNTVTSNKLVTLITVVNRNKAEYYADLIQSFEVNLQAIALADGTADAKTMRYLGLTDTEKAVIFSVVQENRLPDALNALDEKFKTVKGGKGIAFTIPLTSVIGTLLFGFLSNNRTVVKEDR
ncbi:MAG: hypothetical protein HFJ81_02650 [Clostridia bacterium]|nr:hypothetical protein [Clostridia bacterium]